MKIYAILHEYAEWPSEVFASIPAVFSSEDLANAYIESCESAKGFRPGFNGHEVVKLTLDDPTQRDTA